MHNKIFQYLLYFIETIITVFILNLLFNLSLDEMFSLTITFLIIDIVFDLFDDNNKHKPRMA